MGKRVADAEALLERGGAHHRRLHHVAARLMLGFDQFLRLLQAVIDRLTHGNRLLSFLRSGLLGFL